MPSINIEIRRVRNEARKEINTLYQCILCGEICEYA